MAKLTAFDKQMVKAGYTIKIILPKGKGQPLYTKSAGAAAQMAREYGSARIVVLKK